MTTETFRTKLEIKSFEAISVQSLDVHYAFGDGIVALAQDIAYHHVKSTKISVTGIKCLSRTTPCMVLPVTSARKNIYVVGGLESLFMARTISLENSVFCQVLQRALQREHILAMERERLLTIAPIYCRGSNKGAALLKRVWKSCTDKEKNEIYGVTRFKDFASQLGITLPRQVKAPHAQTRATYTPSEQKRYPGF